MVDHTINAEAIWRGDADALFRFYRLYLEHFNSDAAAMNEVYRWTPAAFAEALDKGREVYARRSANRNGLLKAYTPWQVSRLLGTDQWVLMRTWICDSTMKSGQELYRDGDGPALIFNCQTAATTFLRGITQ